MAGLEVTVKIADTEMFHNMLQLFMEIANDEDVPEAKRRYIVDRLLEIGAIKE